MPYLFDTATETVERGTPMMRPMLLEFPDDPAVEHLERQYMLGGDLLVAPVFNAAGDVDYYLPEGTWYSVLTGEAVAGGRWVRERHDYTSVPLLLRPGGVVLLGDEDARPEDARGTGLLVHPDFTGERAVACADETFTVRRDGSELVVTGPTRDWTLQVAGGAAVAAAGGTARIRLA